MCHLRFFVFVLVLWLAAILMGAPALATGDDERAIEAVVRNFERATEQFEFSRADSMLAPGARWIEHGNPEPAQFGGNEASKRWETYKAAKMRIEQRLRDFDIQIHSDVAWVTFDIDSKWTADNEAAVALNENLREWRGSFVESIVLVKTTGIWKIALGHTSPLPTPAN